MKKHLIILVFFLTMGNLFAQNNNGWQVQVGPEVNFTEATTVATDTTNSKDITTISYCLSAGLMKNILADNIYIGGFYSFGRASYSGESANVHKYTLVGSVISGDITFSLVQEYIMTKLNNIDADGSGFGVKISYIPLKNSRLGFWLSANQKNQALGAALVF